MVQALLYLAAVILLGLAAVGVLVPRGPVALLGAACGLPAFALPTITAGFR